MLSPYTKGHEMSSTAETNRGNYRHSTGPITGQRFSRQIEKTTAQLPRPPRNPGTWTDCPASGKRMKPEDKPTNSPKMASFLRNQIDQAVANAHGVPRRDFLDACFDSPRRYRKRRVRADQLITAAHSAA